MQRVLFQIFFKAETFFRVRSFYARRLHLSELQESVVMKKTFVSILVASFLLPGICLAQPPSRQEAGSKPNPGFGKAWEVADQDGDGVISRVEFGGLPRVQRLPDDKREALFVRLDKDADGKLSRSELSGMRKRPPMKRLWELDIDQSGGVSFEEFKRGKFAQKLPAERQEKVFKRLDADGDGMISRKDRPQPRDRKGRPDGPQGGDRPERIRGFNRQLDANGDGALSFEEFRNGPAMKNLSEDQQEDRFESLDRNKDQKLSPEDFPLPQPPEESSRKENPR